MFDLNPPQAKRACGHLDHHDGGLTSPRANRYSAHVANANQNVKGEGASGGPVYDEAILWTDGAARGNPGPAGVGAILKTPSGEVIAEESLYLGHTTNNIAEYRALLLGLERALACGVRKLEVRADSELLIKQLRGEYRVRNAGLKPLFEQATLLLARFSSVKLAHVRREMNSEADRLANRGIDSHKSQPP